MDDRAAIRQLKYRYCYALNDFDRSRVVALFTADARFESPAVNQNEYPHDLPSEAAIGHDELRAVFDAIFDTFETTAHLVANPVIDVDGDMASGRWYYLAVLNHGDRTEWAQGRYDDTYRCVDGLWKIATCRIRRHAELSSA